MNIAVFSHYFSPEIGAPSSRVYDLAQQWMKAGDEVQVVTCFPNHPAGQVYLGYEKGIYQFELLDGIGVHRNWTYITPNCGFIKRCFGHLSFLPSSLLLSHLSLLSPDVIIGSSPTFFAAMAAAVSARLHRVPFIMEVRDLWPAIFVELGVLKNERVIHLLEQWELLLYRMATKIITVTESFRVNLIARGVPSRSIVTIPNGAEVDFWKPGPKSSEINGKLGLANSFVILYIGAHGISQGLNRILEAANLLRDYQDIKFVFVGEGASKQELVGMAKERNLKNVLFHNPVNKEIVREFYNTADLCLVPLKNIPLFSTFIPSKMFEIMAAGKPVLASLQGEAASILTQSRGAMVVPPENSEAIANAILELKKDSHKREEMGKSGRSFVQEHYSRGLLSTRYRHVIAEAIESFAESKK